jgi:CCR4-NOT transcription complex subunit 9
VSTVLNNMVSNQLDKPSPRLLKHIIRCYNRLAENPRALIALRENMPIIVKDPKIFSSLDESSKKCLKTLYDSTSMDPSTSSDATSLQ